MCRQVSALTEHSFLGSRVFDMVQVVDFMKHWLAVGIAPPQGMEFNSPVGEIDFATDQTVRPVLVDRVSAAEQVDDTVFVAAPDKDRRHPEGAHSTVTRPLDRKAPTD